MTATRIDPDVMFRVLSPEDEAGFRGWARNFYRPGTTINPLWHPVVRDECEVMDAEAIDALADETHAGEAGGY